MDDIQSNEKCDENANGISPLLVVKGDVVLAQNIVDCIQSLFEVRRKVESQELQTLCFQNQQANEAAKKYLLAQINIEISLASLISTLLNAKKLLEVSEFPPTSKIPTELSTEVIRDTQTALSWLSYIGKMHSQHCDKIVSFLTEFILSISPGREELFSQIYQQHLTCKPHSQKVISKSLDGQNLLCMQCIQEKQQNEKQ